MGDIGSSHGQVKHKVSGTNHLYWMCKPGLYACMEGGSGSRSSLVIPTAQCQPMAVLSCLKGKETQVEARSDWQVAKELHWSLVKETPAPGKVCIGMLRRA